MGLRWDVGQHLVVWHTHVVFADGGPLSTRWVLKTLCCLSNRMWATPGGVSHTTTSHGPVSCTVWQMQLAASWQPCCSEALAANLPRWRASLCACVFGVCCNLLNVDWELNPDNSASFCIMCWRPYKLPGQSVCHISMNMNESQSRMVQLRDQALGALERHAYHIVFRLILIVCDNLIESSTKSTQATAAPQQQCLQIALQARCSSKRGHSAVVDIVQVCWAGLQRAALQRKHGHLLPARK